MAEEIKVLVADVSTDVDDIVNKITSLNSKIKVVDVCALEEDVIKKSLKLRPDIVVLDSSLLGMEGISVVKILKAAIPNVVIIIISEEKIKLNLDQVIASGAVRYISKPFTAQTITNVIISLYKSKPEITESINSDNLTVSSNVIAIFSTKGGVGKTIISVNLAAELARVTGEKVALLDFDFQFGNIPVLLNLYPKKTIVDLVDNIENLDKDLLEVYLTEHKSGVKVLAAPVGPEFSEYITPRSVEEILRVLKQSYKYIVIDMASSLNDTNIAALDETTKILLITTMDMHTVKNTKLGIKVLKSLGYEDEKTLLVLNKYRNNCEITSKDLEQAVGMKVSYIIPEDALAAANAINNGEPFVITSANGKLANSIKKVADYFTSGKKKEFTNEKKFLWW